MAFSIKGAGSTEYPYRKKINFDSLLDPIPREKKKNQIEETKVLNIKDKIKLLK